MDQRSQQSPTRISLRTGSIPCLYTYDIDEGVSGIISKFADDTKIANTVASNNQVREMQNNLDRLSEWGQT